MRLGLLGPAGENVAALGRAAEFLLNGARVHRAVYLGNDGALERAVRAWAERLVGDDPSDIGAWNRALLLAETGTAAEIEHFVATERARLRLQALEALPPLAERVSRTSATLNERFAVLIHDKAQLEEEDILAANILLFGKSDGPLIRRIGARWFVTPGPITDAGGGIAVLDDEHDEVIVTMFDLAGQPTHREVLASSRPKGRAPGDA